MKAEELKLLTEISNSLKAINARQETQELFAESNKLFDRSDARVENATNQIQNTFDRIHDKVFNFNNGLIAAYLLLGSYPSERPILPLWTTIFPVLVMALMIYVDVRQMGIHRFAANEQQWTNAERDSYGGKIDSQTRLSLFSMFLSVCCLAYLVVKLGVA
ncbi:hypothetical protein [Pedobacter endophyticus]|uniref:Uncharacterized protein n=1 Tax=Pedobacter endophyticus TaxID=2789740 RepID=A0A7U3Q3M2_9SPHI|nr:hypothetical protein [Pedobacter endophyticus]QPH37902.1 hypothetical protein IZT61_12365 [Pedobacter endophyticus]